MTDDCDDLGCGGFKYYFMSSTSCDSLLDLQPYEQVVERCDQCNYEQNDEEAAPTLGEWRQGHHPCVGEHYVIDVRTLRGVHRDRYLAEVGPIGGTDE